MSTTDSTTPAAHPKAEGPQTYSERRLLDITKATEQIAFWVRLWSILSVVAFVLFLIANVVSHTS